MPGREAGTHGQLELDPPLSAGGASHHEQVRAHPEQLRHSLDSAGAVEDDLSADRVLEPLGKVDQGEGQAFETDEILDDEAGLLHLLTQLTGAVAVTGEPAGHASLSRPLSSTSRTSSGKKAARS